MPRKNETDIPVNCWVPKDRHFAFRTLQLSIEERTGVKPILEDLILEAALFGLEDLIIKEQNQQ